MFISSLPYKIHVGGSVDNNIYIQILRDTLKLRPMTSDTLSLPLSHTRVHCIYIPHSDKASNILADIC